MRDLCCSSCRCPCTYGVKCFQHSCFYIIVGPCVSPKLCKSIFLCGACTVSLHIKLSACSPAAKQVTQTCLGTQQKSCGPNVTGLVCVWCRAMHGQLLALRKLVQLLDPPMHAFMESKSCLNYFFCYRWLLIHFKRDFSFDEVSSSCNARLSPPLALPFACSECMSC